MAEEHYVGRSPEVDASSDLMVLTVASISALVSAIVYSTTSLTEFHRAIAMVVMTTYDTWGRATEAS